MTCAEIVGLLDRLMDGELSEEERRELEAHGESCPTCAEQIRATLQMKALFEEMEPEVDVPLAAQAKWRRAIREDAAQRRRKRLTRWVGSVAAALVVLVGVGLALNGGLSPKQDSAAIMPAGDSAAEVETVREAEEADRATTLGEVTSGIAVVETDGANEAPQVVVDSADEAPAEADGAYEAQPVRADSAKAAPAEPDAAYEASAMEADEAFESAESDSAMEAPMVQAKANETDAMPSPTAEPAAEAMQAGSSDAEYDEEEESDAESMVEDAEEMEAAVAAPLSPACELDLQVTGVDSICMIVRELADDFDATADVQAVEDGSANIYVMIDAEAAPAFMEAVLMLDKSEAKPAVPEVAEAGMVQILLVLRETP